MKIQTGKVYITNDGGSVTVVEYRDSRNVVIEHNDLFKHRAVVRADKLRDGKIKNPFHPSVYGVGFVGVGDHPVSIDGKMIPAYKSWVGMLERCYDAKYQVSRPTYIGCSVDPDWHNFQTYAEWFYSQLYSQISGFALDKDLRVSNNKVYSERTCSFVPQQINTLLIDCGASRGKYPQGVSANGKGFRACLGVNGKSVKLGTYPTPEQAYAVYKKAKEDNVKSMANKWRDWLHPTVYANLMGWML